MDWLYMITLSNGTEVSHIMLLLKLKHYYDTTELLFNTFKHFIYLGLIQNCLLE